MTPPKAKEDLIESLKKMLKGSMRKCKELCIRNILNDSMRKEEEAQGLKRKCSTPKVNVISVSYNY